MLTVDLDGPQLRVHATIVLQLDAQTSCLSAFCDSHTPALTYLVVGTYARTAVCAILSGSSISARLDLSLHGRKICAR
jgi:hypothetical protein